MKPINPVYIKALIIVIVLWIINTTLCLVDLYMKVGKMEHEMVHVTFNKGGLAPECRSGIAVAPHSEKK